MSTLTRRTTTTVGATTVHGNELMLKYTSVPSVNNMVIDKLGFTVGFSFWQWIGLDWRRGGWPWGWRRLATCRRAAGSADEAIPAMPPSGSDAIG